MIVIDWEQTSSVKNPTQEDEEYQRVEKMINDAMDEAEKLASQEQKKKKSENSWTIRHSWFKRDDIRQKYVQYAYKLWWMDLVTLMECENWNRSISTRWDGWDAIWLCQMNIRYHSLPAEYYTSRQVQVEYCNQKFRWWTRFYWPSRNIKGQRCSEYVKSRFYFE